MNRRAIAFWVGLGVALVGIGVAYGRPGSAGEALDPDSTGPLGTHALIALVTELGGTVERELPGAGIDRALLLADRLTPDQRDEVESWVRDGGTLVVTEPGSAFSPPPDLPVFEESGRLLAGTCTVAGLEDLALEASAFLLVPDTGADARCFGDGTRSFLQVTNVGDGQIVALGGGLVLTNRYLDEADNAVLATQLLLPAGDPGGSTGGSVAVLYEPVVTPGSRTLRDLIPSGARWSVWQLLVAFGCFALWQGWRFGRPVIEPQPVKLPGSLLVRATAELQRRAGSYAEASEEIRSDLERRLRHELKAPPDLDRAQLAGLASEQTGVAPDIVGRALLGATATGGSALAMIVADTDAVNNALDARPGQGGSP